MKFITTIFLLLFTHSSFAQIKQIELGTSHHIHSKILNEKREYWVHLPRNYDQHSSRKYPVLYLLDGQSHFLSVTGMVDQLSEEWNTKFPEMIIVGVLSTLDRTRDLTPTHIEGDHPNIDSTSCKDSGGNDKFIVFLEKELIPQINASYSASSYRVLVGHSFGGLTVVNVLLKHTHLFNDYVAIDPSIWWDHKYMLNEAKKSLTKIYFKEKSLFIGIANTTVDLVHEKEILQDTSYTTNHIRAIFELEKLFSNTKTDLRFSSNYYPFDTHSSVPFITTYDALRFIFTNYELKIPLHDTTIVDSAFISKIQSHSNYLNETFGHGTPISFEFIDECGYLALDAKNNKEANYLFELNVKNYPKMWESYYALGDYYSEIPNLKTALEYYKKAYKKLHYFVIKERIKEVDKLLKNKVEM